MDRHGPMKTGIRASISAVIVVITAAACGASAGTPARSCVPRQSDSSVPGGTRVDDLVNGFAITLPAGWAQIELASGDVAPAFSGLTMEPGTAALVKAIGSSARRDGYEWLAVDLAPGARGGQSAPPADLLVDLSPANGATLDTIAARLTTDLRGNGVTGDIEQIRLALAGGKALGIRFSEITQDLNGQAIVAAESYYIALRGDTQFSLVFSVAAENAPGSAAVFNAMAQSLEFLNGIVPGCSGGNP